MRVLMLLLMALAFGAQAEDAIRFDETQIPWKAGPPTLPAGSEIAVLEGNPAGEDWFTMRVRIPAGGKLPPHWHPRPERITVLSGAIGIGYGETFDQTQLKVFRAGSYYVTPPEVRHYAAVPEDTVVQITTKGPWKLHPVEAKK